MRDLRVNHIFEGSREIMHLMIAREAVAEHLKAAGDLLAPGGDLKMKADAALHAGVFYSKWLPQLASARASTLAPTTSSTSSPATCATSRVPRAS